MVEMRIMHTSDWHLGKSIHGINLDEDQMHAVDLIAKELVDGGYRAVLIAGDIFDRAIPPTTAIEILSDFLERVSSEGIEIVIVPGNHDNPERLDFCSGIMSKNRVHLRCRYDEVADPIILTEGGEKVQIFCLPFVEDAMVKAIHPDASIDDHASAVGYLIERMRGNMVQGIPSILVAHEYTGRDVSSSDSERELLLGNQGRIGSEVFAGFDYVALGHLHGPQTASRENSAVYSGSIIQYSFSEYAHEKGTVLISVENGRLVWKKVPLEPLRKMVLVSDTLENILSDPKYDRLKEHYVGARLTDTGAKFDILVKLRERFPHLMDTVIVRKEEGNGPGPDKVRAAIDSPRDLFSLFLDKFHWEDPEKRGRAFSFFDEAMRKAEHSSRRDSE